MDGSFCSTAPGASRRTATRVLPAQARDLRGENCGDPQAQCAPTSPFRAKPSVAVPSTVKPWYLYRRKKRIHSAIRRARDGSSRHRRCCRLKKRRLHPKPRPAAQRHRRLPHRLILALAISRGPNGSRHHRSAYRCFDRRKRGFRCATIELRESEITFLIKIGLLAVDAPKTPTALGSALNRYLDDHPLGGWAYKPRY